MSLFRLVSAPAKVTEIRILNFWPKAFASVLPRGWSDHRPIILKLTGLDYGPVPFRFFSVWMECPGFQEMVDKALEGFNGVGRADIILKEKLKRIKQAIKSWNADLRKKERRVEEELTGVCSRFDQLAEGHTLSNADLSEWANAKSLLVVGSLHAGRNRGCFFPVKRGQASTWCNIVKAIRSLDEMGINLEGLIVEGDDGSLRVSFSESGTRMEKSRDHDTINTAAIAAATFAIHSFEEKMSSQQQKKDKTRQVEASIRTRTSQVDKAPSFARPSRPREPYANRSLSIHGSGNTNVDTWEKAELLKIEKRYEKCNLTILEWENQKKTRAKHRVEEKKKELDERRLIDWQHYQNKLARIDRVAGGARSQAEEKRRKEEQKIKERSKEMKSLGVSSPKYCFLC
ncbi:hypothetical protein SSX86_013895 [Deinandra increscens subsp. villosa]|uniref:Remorin C-terminal domain-containing protein n=1 Tax=Deinandra increscens subsp. villosa TaxID=3103831 RepID=A0AAP0D641_9ASTR